MEIYGGVPLNTWLDRDLGISGRLALRGPGGGVESRLVQIDEPLLRVPQLAIHLDRTVNEGLALDRQRHLAPLWALGEPEEVRCCAGSRRPRTSARTRSSAGT